MTADCSADGMSQFEIRVSWFGTSDERLFLKIFIESEKLSRGEILCLGFVFLKPKC